MVATAAGVEAHENPCPVDSRDFVDVFDLAMGEIDPEKR